MDWDELKPRPKPTITVGEDLTPLSVAELEARIQALDAEIGRTRAEMTGKRAQKSAADSIFKS